MKRFLLLFLLISTSILGQKVEHGVLGGATIGFTLQDKKDIPMPGDKNFYHYNNDVMAGGIVGYRLRFLPEKKSFFDLDFTVGFEGMNSYRFSPYFEENGNGAYEGGKDGKNINDFFMPISLAVGWNYRISNRFHLGLGLAPTLYVQPKAAFDLPVIAKVGYRIGKLCELEFSYSYGSLNVLNHFNKGQGTGRTGHVSDINLSVYIPLSYK